MKHFYFSGLVTDQATAPALVAAVPEDVYFGPLRRECARGARSRAPRAKRLAFGRHGAGLDLVHRGAVEHVVDLFVQRRPRLSPSTTEH